MGNQYFVGFILSLPSALNILTKWSVTQVGSYDEKTGGRISSWTVPLITFLCPVLEVVYCK